MLLQLGAPLHKAGVEELVLVDRDVIEAKNLKRQNFTPDDVGHPKVEALAERFQHKAKQVKITLTPIFDWFDENFEARPDDLYMVAADNHVARFNAIQVCDRIGSCAIIMGNTEWTADANWYDPFSKDTQYDILHRYPEIATDKSDDPTNPSCNSDETLAAAPQTALANQTSAIFGMRLLLVWLLNAPKMDLMNKTVSDSMPIEFIATKFAVKTTCPKDLN
jgi:hypothetical protein